MNTALLLLLLFANGPPAGVRAVLDGQVSRWNRGDLAGFLRVYRHSPDLVFFSNGVVTRGFEAIRTRFEKRYGTATDTMGRLSFEDLEVTVLSPDAAFAQGRYRLQYSSGQSGAGIFSLLLRKSSGRWEIVHDHTSTEPPLCPPPAAGR